MNQRVRLMALGGLDEDGKNMYVIEIDDDIFVVEAGLKYPNDNNQLGVEYIIPDFSYLVNNAERVKAVFVSHGHDDVMMAISHLLKRIDVDIYATALTARIIQFELGRKNKKRIKILKRSDKITINGHVIRTFPVMQSIADSIGLIFETAYGAIIYSSEFIIDYDFTKYAFGMDISSLSSMTEQNVLCLMTESVAALRPGHTNPKHRITERVEPYFEHDGRLIISLYKQNLFRIIEILELAAKYKRKIFFYDDEHMELLRNVEELGYYQLPKDIILKRKEFNNQRQDVVVIVSGSGNKVFKLVNRIAIGEDRLLELNENDTVIVASPIVPGTEKEASAMENDLYKAGVNVVKFSSRDLFTMHASREDLKTMLYLVKPKYYLPVKGEYAALAANADIAVEMGYRPDRIILLDNGQFATFNNGKLVSTRDMIDLNDTLIDGSNKNDVSSMVLKDRETLSTDGTIVIGVVLDFKTKTVIGGPDVQSRGVIYLKDAENIIAEIAKILISTIDEYVANGHYENVAVRMEAKKRINRYVLKETGKKPMIMPVIVEINNGDNNG